MRRTHLGLFVGGLVLVVGLAALLFHPIDPLAGLRRIEHQAALVSGTPPAGMNDRAILLWLALTRQHDVTKIWARRELEMDEQVRLGNLARFQVPLTNPAAGTAQRSHLFTQITQSAQTRHPEGAWTIQYLSNAVVITAPPSLTNEWIQLIARLQAAH